MVDDEYIESFREYFVPNYAPVDFMPDRADGSRMWDERGKEYVDFAAGIAVSSLGHNHPRILATLREQAEKLWHVSNWVYNRPGLDLAELLCSTTFAEKVFLSNSGTEANEAALKIARRYAHKNYGPEKYEIVSFHKSFHGRSLFTVTAGGAEKYRTGFGPPPPGIVHAVYNDLADIESKISDKTCAVIMEPIIAEGGVIEGTPEFIRRARELCDRRNALLIFDEVQTGVGRTGRLYAYQGLDIVPDILTSAKALGAGFPIGATLTTTKIAQCFGPGDHGSTFGGNPLASAIARAVLGIVDSDEFLKGVQFKGKHFVGELTKLNEKQRIFKRIRGRGLLIGAELEDEFRGRAMDLMKEAMREGLYILVAGPDVMRFTPSLIIPGEDVHEGMVRLERAITSFMNT